MTTKTMCGPNCKCSKHTDTPRTDALIMECPGHLQEVSLANLAMDLERELAASKAVVERLKGLVMEAARKGDELLEPYRLRAEKAETLLKQIHSFVEAINKTNK